MDELRIKLLDQGAVSDNSVTCGFPEAWRVVAILIKQRHNWKKKMGILWSVVVIMVQEWVLHERTLSERIFSN